MPMLTRARSLVHKSNPVLSESATNPVPCDIAATRGGASSCSALAPAPSSIPHPEAYGSPLALPDQSAQAPIVSSPSIHSLTKSLSKSSARSSSTVKAQQLAARVEHARRLVKIELEREKAAAEREKASAESEKVAAEREKALADIELQDELAIIARSSSHSSRVDYVDTWLVGSHNYAVVSDVNQVCPCDYETGHKDSFDNVCHLPTSAVHCPPLDVTKPEATTTSLLTVREPKHRDALGFAARPEDAAIPLLTPDDEDEEIKPSS